MPIYEYYCSCCDAKIEKLHAFSDPPLQKCETCGSAVSKLVSLSSFTFKGTGWYVTDYKKPQSTAKDTKDKEDKPNSQSVPSTEPAKKPTPEAASGSSSTAH
ncbi:MAG: zinc ribbon domain-containing protein [Deltaproteobacteria bacterium]|nr:zinc ribbon domain-containing protein [Deltaproteobacteria bacterium]